MGGAVIFVLDTMQFSKRIFFIFLLGALRLCREQTSYRHISPELLSRYIYGSKNLRALRTNPHS